MTFAKSSIGAVPKLGELIRDMFGDSKQTEQSPEREIATNLQEEAAPIRQSDMASNTTSIEDQTADATLSSAVGERTEIASGVSISDEAVLVMQAKRDPASFGVLYERYVDRVYAYIYNRVGNAQDSEDLTARTFYRALSRLDSYEDRGFPFSAWLFRIAHNLVANWHRDHGKRRFLSLDRIWSHSRDDERPETHIEQQENHNALWDAINRLPEDRRDLLIYKFSSRLSNIEIGDIMDKSESAIKSLYFRTLAALRTDLESRNWEK